jgi:predicted DNA-binding WGR domain protein
MIVALYKLKHSGEMNYYYMHDYQGHLFSPYTLTVIWGKNFSMGKEKSFTFNTQNEMDRKVQELFKDKLSSGFRLLYTYPPSSAFETLEAEHKKKVS